MREACTLEEVQAARKLVVEWLQDHPDDQTILGEGESLVMLEEGLRITQAQPEKNRL